MDGSFHSPEWHAARLASLKTTHTLTWEEYKQKQKEEELKKQEVEADTDKLMREYRAQLDAERAMKLSKGRNYSSDISRKGRRESSQIESAEIPRGRKAKRESIRKGDHQTQAHLLNLQVVTKTNLGSQGQVLRGQRGRGNTSLEADTQNQSKDEADGPAPQSKFFGSLKS
ncbi:hypothetical protein AtNW77_Chr2g0266431 [Arabidopsis thaliana]|uniref:Corepressor n=2 Tax=Arabidopsis TaxID=3701 RepID=B3H7M7_ARATH|nr:corepressor [Arabidopsis thaliana]AEC10327.1 corepressor [Arabidopsis thaliana]KAG7639613.1 hypothetical protein ISN45_At02g039110 [Arabidopsis thaliana x Arabidopsis arenosa]|eukprot:NP_001118519.1 corepressor [Arabidopsis thaliana]